MISILDNFDYGGQEPNFTRDLFETVADMVAFSENYLPDVFECNVKEDGKRYRYMRSNAVDEVTGKWRVVGEGGGDLENYYTKAEMDTAFEGAKADWEKYTDDAIEVLKDDAGKAVDALPTFNDGVITYYQDGEEHTTTDVNTWFYYTEDDVLKQTKFVDGVAKTITSGGGVNFDAYAKKEDGGVGLKFEDASHPLWTDVDKAIKGLIAKVEYVKPEIKSFTKSVADVFEIGATVSGIDFAWTLNKDVTAQTLTDCTVAPEDRSATYGTDLKTTKTFTLTVSDGENSASKSVSVSFQNKIYCGGAAEPTDYDSAFVLGLATSKFATAKKGTYSANVGAGQYGYIAYPKSMGQITSVYIGGFETTVENCGDISFTNASGGNAVYNIVRTSRQGLGSISMEVK